ncbi:MAG TPA: hypothetical protein VLC09_09460 [Polyangiaceae bacterium]|nr:hypothetical protein [Polyangiaceae bacterium]
MGKVWLFDARFPPGQTTSIRHSYDVFMGSNLSFIDSVDYVTQTGRGWAGKIGKARFRVMLPPATHTVWVDRWGKPRWVERGAEPAHWELEFEATDWVPPRGIGATFQHSVWGPVDLGADRLSRSGVRAEDECPSSPVAPDTAKQRRMCVNLIYALSGYPFVNPQLAKYFYGNPFDWRVEKAPYSDEERVYRRGLRPRADFDVSWITSIDRSILRYLATLEFPGEASDPIDVPAANAANREEDERADRRLQAILKQPAPETAGSSSPTKPEGPTPQAAEASSPTKPEGPTPQAAETTPQAPARGCGACGPFGTQGVTANRFAGALVALACLAWARSRMRGRTRPDER